MQDIDKINIRKYIPEANIARRRELFQSLSG